MIDLQNSYQLLGVKPSNTWAEIKKVYRKLVKQHHPDRFLNNSAKQQAESKFKQINLAYEYLERHHNSVASNTSIGKNSFRSRVNKTNPQDLYEAGAKLAEEKQFTEAIAQFDLAIKLAPNYLQAYQYRGFLLEKLGCAYRAKAHFERVRQLQQPASPQTVKTSPTYKPIEFTNDIYNQPMTQKLDINWDKTKSVAQKKIWLAVILSFFTGIASYTYTARYRALLISLSLVFGVGIVTAVEQEDSDILSGCVGIFLLTSLVDNATAIHHSREKLKIKQHFESRQHQNYYHTNPEALTVALLQLIKNGGQVSLANLVIATKVDADLIRDRLLVLQQQDLITAENRLEDGAMVYRLV